MHQLPAYHWYCLWNFIASRLYRIVCGKHNRLYVGCNGLFHLHNNLQNCWVDSAVFDVWSCKHAWLGKNDITDEGLIWNILLCSCSRHNTICHWFGGELDWSSRQLFGWINYHCFLVLVSPRIYEEWQNFTTEKHDWIISIANCSAIRSWYPSSLSSLIRLHVIIYLWFSLGWNFDCFIKKRKRKL